MIYILVSGYFFESSISLKMRSDHSEWFLVRLVYQNRKDIASGKNDFSIIF